MKLSALLLRGEASAELETLYLKPDSINGLVSHAPEKPLFLTHILNIIKDYKNSLNLVLYSSTVVIVQSPG